MPTTRRCGGAGYRFVPALYIIATTALCLDLLVLKPAHTWPGLIIVLPGIPVYHGWRAASRSGATG